MPAKKKEANTKTSKVESTPQKKAPVKKSSVKVKQPSVTFFSWEQWKQTFVLATKAWKHIIGRYTLVLLLALGFQLLGVLLLTYGLVAVAGGTGQIESLVANLFVGTWPDATMMMAITATFLVWLVYLIFVAVLSKVAFVSVIKDFVTGQKRPVISLFFKEGFRLLARYIGVSIATFFYVMWPVIIFLSLFIAWDLMLLSNNSLSLNVPILDALAPVLFVVLFIVSLSYAIYAGIRVLFMIPTLIHSDKNLTTTFKLSKQITKGAWAYTALMWGLFVILLYAINRVLSTIAYYDPIILVEAANPQDIIRLTDLLAFCLSLFIFGPITTAFQYLLMLQTAKNQSVKL